LTYEHACGTRKYEKAFAVLETQSYYTRFNIDKLVRFYRAMLYAERGIVTASRLSLRDVEVS